MLSSRVAVLNYAIMAACSVARDPIHTAIVRRALGEGADVRWFEREGSTPRSYPL